MIKILKCRERMVTESVCVCACVVGGLKHYKVSVQLHYTHPITKPTLSEGQLGTTQVKKVLMAYPAMVPCF